MSSLPTSADICARLKLNADGTLSNPKMEEFVILWASGLTQHEAWIAIGKENKGGQGDYRRQVVRNRFLQERLEMLVAEREELTAQGIWGRLEWQAGQNYRLACAKGDLAGMTKATELLMKVAERSETPAAAPAEKGRGPGAPVVEPPSTQREPSQIRLKMLEKPSSATVAPA